MDLRPATSQGVNQAEEFPAGPLGGISPTVVDITTTGFPDYALRSLAQAVRTSTQPLPLIRLEPVNGYFAMTEQSFTPSAALDRDFTWHGEGSWTGLTVPLGDSVLLRAPFLLPAEWRGALHERTTPLYLNRGYPLTLAQEIVFVPPEGARRPRVPEPSASAGGPLRWRLGWQLEDQGRLAARLEVVLAKGELDWDETLVFSNELRRLYGALGHGATYDIQD